MADFNFQSVPGDAYDPTNTAQYEEGYNYGDSEEDDDYDPSNLQFGMTEAQAPVQPPPDDQADSSIITDPSVSTLKALSVEPGHAANKSSVKQRTVGGFVVDDDDDDDNQDDTPMEIVEEDVAVEDQEESAVGVQQRSVTQTPVNATSLPAPDTSIDKEAAQDQDQVQHSSGDAVPLTSNINSASLGAAAAAVSTSVGLTPSQTPVQFASSSAVPLPKARLPQDRVGILEDRIAEDPRGDTDAWLSLIEEYKQRNKIQEVYETYDRFLNLFPQAVSRFFKILVFAY